MNEEQGYNSVFDWQIHEPSVNFGRMVFGKTLEKNRSIWLSKVGNLVAHGGAIWMESTGHNEETLPGSTFQIMIPLRKFPPADKSAKLFCGLLEPQAPLKINENA